MPHQSVRAGGLGRLLLFAAIAWLTAACESADERLNVVVVTFDTTRADHLSAYGHPGAHTPAVDRLAAEGVLFEQAVAPVPITLPSHSSLMTGKVPPGHGVRDNGIFVLPESQRTLAEILRDAGWRTGAAIAAFPLTEQFGIGQGFELFDDHVTGAQENVFGQRVLPKQDFFFDERSATQVNAAALPWLEAHADEPFFLWLHYFDPHHPHEPPRPYDQLFAHDLYLGEIAAADEAFGAVLDRLEQLGVEDRTLVVLTADHGEGRGEHNESTHSLLVYQSTLHVPLIVRLPGGPAGRRVAERVGLVDVLPTVLDVLGLDLPDDVHGESLVRHFAPQPTAPAGRDRRLLYAETLSPRLSRQWGELRALYYDDFKYIHGPRPELYDLGADPDELDDLVATQPTIAADLERRLADYLEQQATTAIDASVAIDDESLRRLQALGYLQASGAKVGPIEERLRSDGDPPQDHASTITAYSHAKALLFHDKPVEAREFLVDLLRDDPDNPHYLDLMVAVDLRLGRLEEALQHLAAQERQSAIGGYPPRHEILQRRAGILSQQGKEDAAYAELREAVALVPDANGLHQLAKIHQRRGERNEERRFLERALEADDDHLAARLDLAVWNAVSGQPEAADRAFRETLSRHPYLPRAHYNYGAFLAQTGDLDGAVERFRRAVELRDDYLRAHQALVELLADQEPRAARRHLERLETLAPDSQETRVARRILAPEAGRSSPS
ncbi:MAG: sulfatase-like hydrolase/transferase [Acidobacteriota bacterium]